MSQENTFDVLDEAVANTQQKEVVGDVKEIVQEVVNSVVDNVVVKEEVDKDSYGGYTGQCKWFNDKLGFGFITICEGPEKGKDIFVHHSGIKPLNSNYRTLKKGEYINFNVIDGMNGLQAVDVTGIRGGPLMCDHVTGKRVVMPGGMQMPMQQPMMPVPNGGGKYNNAINNGPTQWQTVSGKKPMRPVAGYVKPVNNGGANPVNGKPVTGKRYPPNNRPYKRTNSA